jgi:hypothetical protein
MDVKVTILMPAEMRTQCKRAAKHTGAKVLSSQIRLFIQDGLAGLGMRSNADAPRRQRKQTASAQ